MDNAFFLENMLEKSALDLGNYDEEQIGSEVKFFQDIQDFSGMDLGIVGVNDYRGMGSQDTQSPADIIKEEFYGLYYWQNKSSILDFGNVIRGQSIKDTIEAISEIQSFCLFQNIPLIVIGGSQDLTMGQYLGFKKAKMICNLCNVDASIDYGESEEGINYKNFLHDILLSEPNFLKSYFHIGLQIFYQKPDIINKFSNLEFDMYRIGKIRENFSYIEPCFRLSDMVSVDINAVSNAYSPASTLSPNGFNAYEFCMLGQYTGMSSVIKSLGVYNFLPSLDSNHISSKLISQHLWFFVQGLYQVKNEATLKEKNKFIEYQTKVDGVTTYFYQSKITKRWWMQIDNYKPLPCDYLDYQKAKKNEITERWSSYINLQ